MVAGLGVYSQTALLTWIKLSENSQKNLGKVEAILKFNVLKMDQNILT